MMMDPVLVALFLQILILGRDVLAIQVIYFVVRLVYNMFVRSYPHLSIITLLEAKLHAEGHNTHPHVARTHAD